MQLRPAFVLLAAIALIPSGACQGDGDTKAVTASVSPTSGLGPTTTRERATSPTTGAQPSPTTGVVKNAGGPPANLAPVPFKIPKLGPYQYHERVQPQTGEPSERAVRYELSAVKGKAGVIRWDEADPASGAVRNTGDHYEEIHDRDGLYLLASIVLGKDECRWSPRSALLPRAVIQGGEIETRSTCTVPIDGKPTQLTLVTTLKFLRTHDFTVAGASRPSIDVDRVRVLSGDVGGPFTITSRAVDTYAFDLGVRVRTEDHSTTETGGRSAETTRVLTLTSAA